MADVIPTAVFECAPFDGFSEEARARLPEAGEVLHVAAHDGVYSANEPSDGLYILLSGKVLLVDPLLSTLSEENGKDYDVPGTLLSKGSVLEPFAHRHQLFATEDATLLLVRRERFEALFDEDHPVAFALLDHLVHDISADVRELNHAVQRLLSDA